MNLKQESRLNGVKTNIFNVEDVADDLRVPSAAIMKYMSSELGANLNDKTVINGSFAYDALLKLLDKFITKYVICPNCKYPELIMSLDGKKGLKSICKSCGRSNTHDGQHKAGKIIVQHLQQTGGKDVDMTEKDMKKMNIDEEDDVDGDIVIEKERTKSKKKKEDISDLDADLTIESRRVGKYQYIHFNHKS